MQHLHSGNYRNEFVTHFPGDDSGDKRPRQTPGVLWSKAEPTPVAAPRLLAWSNELATDLGIATPTEQDVQLLGGNLLAPTMRPYAACYAGHQFGSWAGQLGDGRAITLGEWPIDGRQSWELQLKGAGPTPYSRRADGRAVLRSSVREYLMSEAMHHLGVPTTRALALVATGDEVMRDMFYNGNPQMEPGAIVMRAAPSFLRFGNFEMPASREESENLQQLIDWTISRYYPHISGEDAYVQWFAEVVERTATMIVEWLRVGFVHGVMNTDNMSILGLTIDFGPYSMLDDYDPTFTPNTTDLPGRRYAFGKQAAIAKWNLGALGGAVATLLPETEALLAALNSYDDVFWKKYYVMMCRKLGLETVVAEDARLINSLEQMLAAVKPDYTLFFQQLARITEAPESEAAAVEIFADTFYADPSPEGAAALLQFLQQYEKRLQQNSGDAQVRQTIMQDANPKFILRNYLLHEAIEALEAGNEAPFRQLERAMKQPYDAVHDAALLGRRPGWATQKAGCSMLSCSS
ncbi:protein adenylyltransferase SelO [Paracnuella aquatica]|uniref:protein adenylyltransferase SelO n=1 Tax=Paracnuella aquatica TaxID=2268757 RepID=UPI000DEEB51C|nr:YdiU family protein [Paracnuella aquatica]RPD50692.1 YdiU family protein [Paracnuella aquatica]